MLLGVCAVVHGYSWPHVAASWHLPDVLAPDDCCAACAAHSGCWTWTVHPEKGTGCWLHGATDQPPVAVKCGDGSECVSGSNGSAPLPPIVPPPPTPPARCVTSADCSLNGVCELSGCRCDPGWKGSSCAVLDLLPVSVKTHGQVWPPDNRTSSWGANIVWRAGRWEMVASEMGGHCGLASWQHNSFMRHTSSSALHGPFSPREVVMPYFSHNSMPTQMSDGTLVVWHVGLGVPRAPYITGCTDGVTPPSPSPPQPAPKLPSWFPLPFTKDTGGGNWTWQTTNVTTVHPPNDDFHIGNLASHELPNGTVLLSYTVRPFSYAPNATTHPNGFGLAVADSWRGPFRPRFGSWGHPAVQSHGEDSFIWADKRGGFHMIFHLGSNNGAHAYSSDSGWSWSLSKDSRGKQIECYSPSVLDTAGGSRSYGLRQRPALVMGPGGFPVALVTAVGSSMQRGMDRTFTLMQELNLSSVT